jgi:hypothetical protein
MNEGPSKDRRQEAAREIRATLVELLRVARFGGLNESAQHLENAIAEADRAIAGGQASPESNNNSSCQQSDK